MPPRYSFPWNPAPLQKIRLVELPPDPAGRIDQSHMSIGLREISPLRSIRRGILTKDAQMVAKGQQLIQVADRIVDPAHTSQCIDIPECAHQERALRKAKIIIVFVSVKQPLIRQ